jgi:hypothetical protein
VSGTSRFDCYPSDFLNGVIGLTADQIAAYTVIMMLQYDRGRPVAFDGREREISVRCGLPRGRLAKAIEHLIRIGKLAHADGCLENPRTTDELKKIKEKLQKNIENSLSGGNATRQKWEQIRNENSGDTGPTGQPTGQPKQGPIPSPSPSPSPLEKKETRAQERAAFDRFWSVWPHKVGKPIAEKSFNKVCGEADEIIAGVHRYIKSKPPDRSWMNPATFLNQERWKDQPASTGPPGLFAQQQAKQPGDW